MLWLLALVPILGGVVLFAMRSGNRYWLGGAAASVLAATVIITIAAAIGHWTGTLAWGGGLELQVALTPLSAVVAILVPAITLAVVIYASAHEEQVGLLRLVAWLVVFAGAMELLVIAADLLTLLIGWELVGACSWGLIGHKWRESDTGGSANYAFVMTRFGDLGLFFAAMVAFAGTGSFAFADLGALPPSLLGLLAAGILLSAAAKSGQVPFSPWLFRAMAGPTSVSALLHAATMVAAGAYLLARLSPVLSHVPWFGGAVIAIGLVTALAGGIVATAQFHAKKLLAASTSAHFGLMLVAVGAGYPGVAILHLVAHACFKAPLFLAAGIAEEETGSYDLRSMRLGRTLPWTAALAAIAALALAGLPPLGAGWTKEAIVSAAETRTMWIAIGVVVAGGLSAAYATRFQMLAFGRAGSSRAPARSAFEVLALALPVIASVVLSLLWLPGIAAAIADQLGITLPQQTTTGLVLSVVAIAMGLAAGVYFASSAQPDWIARWLGLPVLIDRFMIAPVNRLATVMARIDKGGIDRGIELSTRFLTLLSTSMARIDNAWVDRGVELTVRFTTWLADVGERFGESAADAIPGIPARLVSLSGKSAVKLQTGFSHQYYLMAAGGVVVIFFILWLGI